MSNGWNIAILGATGAVGGAVLEILQERQFPVNNIYLLASEHSVGEVLRFNSRSVMVENVSDFDWSQAQITFFCVNKETARAYGDIAADSGCLVIDTSGEFALEPDIPLVIPSVNPYVLSDFRNRNIIAIAGSLTSQLLLAAKPLMDQVGLLRMHVTNLLSVSAYGKAAIDDFAGQSIRLLNGLPVENNVFAKQLAFNLLPLFNDDSGFVAEERRLIDESRKILQDDRIAISATCIQAPVFYGHAQAVAFEGEQYLPALEARDILSSQANIQVSEINDYPTQVGDASGQPYLSIGHIRNDYGVESLLQYWSVADNIRFGGALIAVETAELLIREYMY